MQPISSEVSMSSTLPSFPPPSVWTWITSLDIIDDFHFGLPCPHSYHHIPYVFLVKIQHVLQILLAWLTVDPSNIAIWHAFLLFHMVYHSISLPPNFLAPKFGLRILGAPMGFLPFVESFISKAL
jgi:hypothetical protein